MFSENSGKCTQYYRISLECVQIHKEGANAFLCEKRMMEWSQLCSALSTDFDRGTVCSHI